MGGRVCFFLGKRGARRARRLIFVAPGSRICHRSGDRRVSLNPPLEAAGSSAAARTPQCNLDHGTSDSPAPRRVACSSESPAGRRRHVCRTLCMQTALPNRIAGLHLAISAG
jgi:hypothetical protein